MRKAIVTGGAGFIGSNLVNRLIEKGIEVVVLDNLSTGKEENINPKAKFIQCDISKSSIFDLMYNMKGADVVFHLAALARVQPSIEDPIPFNEVNITGTLNILLAAHKTGIKRVVYSASSSAYGNTDILPTPEDAPTNPLSPYGLQKYVGEQYCKMFSEVYGLDTVSLRYFNVYGEQMNFGGAYKTVIAVFIEQMQKGEKLNIVNEGNQRRDFTYVGDVCNANILAATTSNKFNGEVFNVGNGDNFSVNEVADMFGGEKKYGEKRIEPFETLADNQKIKSLGWKPTGNLSEWIKNYIKNV
jgi:UDP-glucose 4-epimerase|tara:strand:- start:435 stop:1334 length:900 start_codon:yes stop_codon:yes gene_type:complete